MSPSSSSGPSASTIVVALGIASAVALLAASFADFGDPFAAARVRSEQAVRGKAVEIRLAWNEAQADAPAPPGAGGSSSPGRASSSPRR